MFDSYYIRGPISLLTADPGVASLIPAWFNTFMEISQEIIYTVIFLPLIQEGLLSVTSKKYVHEVLVNCLVELAQ